MAINFDFTEETTDKFWQENNDNFLIKIIKILSSTEDWIIDHNDPEIKSALDKLLNIINKNKNFDIDKEEDFINILCSLELKYSLHLMQYMNKINDNNVISKILIYAESANKDTSSVTGLFLNRNLVFERFQLLSRVFSPERMTLLEKVVKRADENES